MNAHLQVNWKVVETKENRMKTNQCHQHSNQPNSNNSNLVLGFLHRSVLIRV